MADLHPPQQPNFTVKLVAPDGRTVDVTPAISELTVSDSVSQQSSTAAFVITDWAAYDICPLCGKRHIPLLRASSPVHALAVDRPSYPNDLPRYSSDGLLLIEQTDAAAGRMGEIVLCPELPNVSAWTCRIRYTATVTEHIIFDCWPKFRLGTDATGRLYLKSSEADSSEPTTFSIQQMPVGAENHVVLTASGQTVVAYVNGQRYFTAVTSLPTSTSQFLIGSTAERMGQMNGTVRTLRFDWGYAWSAEEAAIDYAAGLTLLAGSEEWLIETGTLAGTFYAEESLPNIVRCGYELDIWNSDRKLFLGTLKKVSRTQENGLIDWAVDADDYTAWLVNRTVAEDFRSDGLTEGKPHLIVQALLQKYAPEIGRALTTDTPTGYIQPSDFVFERIVFARKPLLDCFKELADAIDYDFYVDENRQFRFFDRWTNYSAYTLAEDDTAENAVGCEQIAVDEDTTGLINRVWVFGGQQLSSPYTQQFTGDGAKRVFVLDATPYEDSVTVDGVAKVGGIVGTNDPSDVDYLVDLARNELQFGVAPAENAAIEITYKYEIPVAAVAENAESIAAYGIFETVISDSNLTSRTVAIDRAQTEVGKTASPTRKVSVTRFNESEIRSGQILPVAVSVLSDETVDLLVQEVTHSFDDSGEYTVDLTLGDMQHELAGILADMKRRVLSLEMARITEQIGMDVLDTLTSLTEAYAVSATLAFITPTEFAESTTMTDNITNTLNSTGFLTDEAMVDVCDVVP